MPIDKSRDTVIYFIILTVYGRLLMLSDAKWICAEADIGTVSPLFCKTADIKRDVKRVTAYVSAMGVYELFVNGKKVGNALLSPGWTSYKNRLQYQQYDITELMSVGDNNIGILCGKGWAMGEIGRFLTPCVYTDRISAVARICVEYADGEVENILSDQSWECYTSHILESEIYHGETVDLTADVRLVGAARIDSEPKPPLIPQICGAVTEHERFAVKEVIYTPRGETVLDFGQNIAGYAEIKIKASRGSRMVLSHAEVLDSDGNFYTENLRKARNVNTYVQSGEKDILKPSFSFQGFRYVRLDEYPDKELDIREFTAVAIYTDMKRTGYFKCGYEKLNKLYDNILWGQRGNFVDIPTDCPQRDERLGWTADAQVFCRTACINYNAESFFDKWLGDLAAEQGEDGRIYRFAPFAGKERGGRISAGWSDAAVICPWELYRAYGNKEILTKYYPMMRRWIEYIRNFGDEEYLWIGGDHYGDWLAMDAGEGQRFGATQTDLFASAFYAYSVSLMIRISEAIGEDPAYYRQLYAKVREAFRGAFMKDGMPVIYPKADALSTNRPVKAVTQTSLALILHFGLCDESEREGLARHLARLISENGGRMNTGFIGTPYLLHALSDNGYADVAYSLLLAEHCPSWLFSVRQGATTVWEHWDGIREDGSFWSPEMNSFNHYAYGSVFDWIFANVGGIDVCSDGAGYTHVTVSPVPNRRLGFADCGLMTRYGRLGVFWKYIGDSVSYEITVPRGVTADIRIGEIKKTVSGGVYRYIV